MDMGAPESGEGALSCFMLYPPSHHTTHAFAHPLVCFQVKRVVLLLLAMPFLVTTDFMVADIFTKATDKGTFFKMRNYMMNVNGNLRGPLTEALSACAGASKRLINRMMMQL